ncbi:unnamed protein product [Miscanthus lutarioriparius]|uniref:Leucine-rich repeat-containing N-terminal plant-type domain-containing protein n=1 Tax=Miscanthus lutarioriparius TaxID=422564 RepID=A0A811S524_9POAL|nr:unnamed protein product [Miscanthus lutarioriparius]
MASLYLVHGILMLTLVLLNVHILKSNCESTTRDSEKAALLKLEQDWGKPAALNWSSITNTDHCDWSGVICTDGFVTGRMHPQFGNLSNIKYLCMSNMNIVGEIPDTMFQLSQLRLLDLSSNRLNGMIPSGVWRLRSLEMLYLDNSSLCGHISGPIEAMSLTEINVSNNLLTGRIPEDFGKLKNLTLLLLHDNNISGLIPKGIALLPMLRDMQLSRNFLSGGLPNELGKHSMLFNIEISSNNLSGKLPEGLCSFQALQYIDFSNNRLSGELPKSLLRCRKLRSIFLNNNQLRGSFPSSIWSLPELTMIMIQENGFSGSLPNSLENLTNVSRQLKYANGRKQLISGEVPTNLNPTCTFACPRPGWKYVIRVTTFKDLINEFEQGFLFNPGLCSYNFGNYPMCSTQPGPEEQDKHLKRPIIIFLILGSTILVFTGIFCFIKIRARKKHEAPSPQWKLTTFQPTSYNVEDILCVLTNNNLVGRGGLGKVYKICLGNNCKIAVKKIGNGLKKDGMLEKQFQAEIGDLSGMLTLSSCWASYQPPSQSS